MYRAVYPSYLELVKGVGAAYDLPIERVDLRYMEHWFFTLLWWRLFEYEEFEKVTDYYHPRKGIFDFSECSIVSCHDEKSNNHLIGRNFDVTSDRPHFVVTTELEGAYRTIGNACYMLYHWIEDGFNEKGLYVGVATNGHPSRYNQKEPQYPDSPAVQIIHMARIVLDRCASVDEALELIRSVRIWFPVEVNHLLIADATGKAAVVEFDTSRNMVAFHKEEPYLILTNTAYQEGINYVRDNCSRYRKAENMLKSERGGCDRMLSVMRAIQLKSGNSRTLWTSISDISSQQIDVRFRSEDFEVPHLFKIGR
ncbi:MAG: linear amide C-N hydrolase [Phycisphaerales bacterium]|nr:MAG: linear amide C-N hydrolase [Phycisphaerales bacterium]